MKIALMTYSTKPRGGVVHALNLAEALKLHGEDVKIFALSKEKNASFYKKISVPYYIFKYSYKYCKYDTPEQKTVANVKRMIDKYVEKLPRDFDIYHTQDCVGAVALNRLKKEGLKAPTIRTIHHVDIFNEYRLQKFQEESINTCDIKLVVSKYWKKYLQEKYSVYSDIIYNGIDSARFENIDNTIIRNRFKFGNLPVILFIGGLEPRKGLEYLILAMEQILKKYNNAILIAVAHAGLIERNENDWFKMLIERLHIQNQVKLIDYVNEDEIPKYYAAADVYVMPSRMEGWGIGLMEAMASQKPVVATKSGGITELVRNKKDGILIEPSNVNAIASAVCRLLESKKLRIKYGKCGKERIKKFTWEITARKVLKIYRKVLETAEKTNYKPTNLSIKCRSYDK